MKIPCIFPASREFGIFRDEFAAASPLQRRVRCEPDFRGRIPSMIVGVANIGSEPSDGQR